MSNSELTQINWYLNSRPLKCLNWHSPIEIFYLIYINKSFNLFLAICLIQNIFSKTGYVNGTAFFTFTPEISVLLSTDHAMLMPYHRLLLEINTNREPTAWYLFRRLLLNKRTNFGNSARADRMKISTLLKGCPSLPTYEEVMAGNRHVDDRIIQPFFKAIERLSDAFEYTYLTASGKPFNYKEGITYQDFASGELVITSWKDYPDSWLQQLKASKNKNRKAKRLNKN